jgi:hypothetical protein
MKQRKFTLVLTAALVTSLFTVCGGGGGDDQDTVTGGTVWEAVEAGSEIFGNDGIHYLAYGNGTFVAGTPHSGKMAYSVDGTTWTGIDMPFVDGIVYCIVFINGKFYAGNLRGRIAYSTDGIAWTVIAARVLEVYQAIKPPHPDQGYQWVGVPVRSIAYGNGTFVAAGDDGTMATSPDGENWTLISDGPFRIEIYAGVYYQVVGLAYGNGKFVAVNSGYASTGDKFAYSTDGVKWELVSSAVNDYSARALTFANGKFVTVGFGADRLGKIAYSQDGKNWSAVEYSTFGALPVVSLIYAGSGAGGKFIAGGYDGTLAHSQDGVTWTPVRGTITDIFGESDVMCLAYGNGIFVAGGDVGKLAVSK